MDKNRLSKTLSVALNNQMTNEAYASQIYLSYASWAASQGYSGVATILFSHAQEERNHMMKILEYLLKRCGDVVVSAIAAPPENPASIHNCFEKLFEHEVANTKAIYKLVKLSFDEEDWATWNLLQWFVKEQIEEETFAIGLIDKLKMADNKSSCNELYSLDRDLEKSIPLLDVPVVNP